MRVISGVMGGKKLLDNKFDHIRPTTDKVKQALFTKLQFEVVGKRVLDLFCGTGALGIEALSRGAKEAIFVDKSPKSLCQTKANLKAVGLEAKTILSDALRVLTSNIGRFDIIFVDPPYKSQIYDKVLQTIYERKMLKEGGIVVCEHDKDDQIDFSPFVIVDQKRYGTIMLSYLQL